MSWEVIEDLIILDKKPDALEMIFRDWRNRGALGQMLKHLRIRPNEQGLINLNAWMIDSTIIRTIRFSSSAGKKETKESL